MSKPPERIVTLLPSATEIVCELGLRDKLVGVTHECDYPGGVGELPHVTCSAIDHHTPSGEIDAAVRQHLGNHSALYSLDEQLLVELKPDLIVTQALCEVCAVSEDEVLAVIDRLPGNPRLINLEPMTLYEVLDTIQLVGEVTASQIVDDYLKSLNSRINRGRGLTAEIPDSEKPSVGFLEWIDPPFNAGHWTPEIIEYAGGIDSFGNKHQPSQTIDYRQIEAADPDVLIIALCGFDENRARIDLEILKKRLNFSELTAVRNDAVHIIDGNSYFSRPGPRLVDSLEILFNLFHPNLNTG